MSNFIPSSEKPILKMATDTYTDTISHERIPTQYGLLGIFFTICFFQSIHVIVTAIGAPKRVTVDFHRWKNLFISWIHALLVGTWDTCCLLLYPEMLNDLIEHYNWFTYSMVVFSTGYFIYDFLDLARAGKLFSSWEIILHHWAVTSMFFYNVLTCRCVAYNVVALMAEVNSFFLHSRKLLQMSQVDYSSTLYRAVSMLNLVSFLPCRFGAVSIIMYGMIMYSEHVSPTYFNFLCVAIFAMTFINIILYWRLLKSDLFRRNKSSPSSTKKGSQEHVNNNIKMNNHLNGGRGDGDHTSPATPLPAEKNHSLKAKTN